MPADNLTFRYAENHVTMYEQGADQQILQDHREAMDCLNCEAFLQIGIEAFNWLTKADHIIRRGVLDGCADIDFAEMEQSIQNLAIRWLGPCDFANEWIDLQIRRGFTVEGLEEFRRCEAEMRAIVAFFSKDPEELSDSLRARRDQAIEDLNNGETAEFV